MKIEQGWCNCRLNHAEKKSGHRENERLSTMRSGSLLVSGRGSQAEVGKYLFGFAWIIIRVLCGRAGARASVLFYVLVWP